MYLVFYDEMIFCEYGFAHLIPCVVAYLKTEEAAQIIALKYGGTVEYE